MAGSKQHIVSILLFIFLVSFNELAISSKTKTFRRLSLGPNQIGPESIAFDCNGQGPYVGISDGRILKWRGHHIGWTEFAVTSPNRTTSCNGVFNSPVEKVCGRPVGLRFDMATCKLYIADPSFGLMRVGSNGGIASLLASGVEGKPFKFVNGLDIDSTKKIVYFTDSSTNYYRWEAMQAINNRDRSGRFLKYDIKTGKVTILLRNLYFPNGVALSKKKNFVLVAEGTAHKVMKYWLTGSKAGSYQSFLRLSGRPDNINRDVKGDFWIADRVTKSIKVNEFGNILESLDSDKIGNPSDVQEFKGCIFVGFVDQPYILYSCIKDSIIYISFEP